MERKQPHKRKHINLLDRRPNTNNHSKNLIRKPMAKSHCIDPENSFLVEETGVLAITQLTAETPSS